MIRIPQQAWQAGRATVGQQKTRRAPAPRKQQQERSSLGSAYERNSSIEGCGFHVDLGRRRYPQSRSMGIRHLRNPCID